MKSEIEDKLEISSDYETTYDPSFSNMRNAAEYSCFKTANTAFSGFHITDSPISPKISQKDYVNIQRLPEKNFEDSLDFNTFREDIEEGLIAEQAQLKIKKEQVERAKLELMKLKEESFIKCKKEPSSDIRSGSSQKHYSDTHLIPPLSIPGMSHQSYDIKRTPSADSDDKYDKIPQYCDSYLYKREDAYKTISVSPKPEIQSFVLPQSGRDFPKPVTPTRSRRELNSSQSSVTKSNSLNDPRNHDEENQIDKNLEILSLREHIVELKSKIRLLEQIIRLNNEKHQILDFTNKLHAKMQTHCNIISQLQSENAKLKTCIQYGQTHENTVFDSQDFNSSTISTARKNIDDHEKHCLDALINASDLPETLYELLNQYDIVDIASGFVKYVKSIELDCSMLNRELHAMRLNLISQNELREDLIIEKAGLEAKCLELVKSIQNTQLRITALQTEKSIMNASLQIKRASQSPMRENYTPNNRLLNTTKLSETPMERYVKSISKKPSTPTSRKFVKF